MSAPVLDWKLQEIEAKINTKAEKYEVNETNRNVDSLERTVRELSAQVDGLRSELQTAQETIRQMSDCLLQAGIM